MSDIDIIRKALEAAHEFMDEFQVEIHNERLDGGRCLQIPVSEKSVFLYMLDVAFNEVGEALACLSRPEAQQEREGWKLVPVEPTGPMRTAGHINGLDQGISYFDGPMAGSIYSAMLAAAPPPPAKGEGDG